MGITGLLQFIKDASEPVSVRKYKGQTVAVDTYCWLHKGAFSCAEKLAKGEPTDQYVSYCMKFVDMLLSFGVKPILVFDGCNLPSKQEVEKSRRERRQANLQKGKQLLREGKVSEARDCFTRCVNVTPSMAHKVIKAARTKGVDCVVAPYEADAQLAFLNKAGIAQAVITEDSDLLAFGCKKVILKMDKHGNGLEIDQSHLGRCRSLGDVFTEEKFRYMCILSGCDYLASLYGIGLGKACKLLKMANNPDILKVIKKIGQYLKMNVTVPDEYIEGFVKANNTFLYQLVFDPVRRQVTPLNPYPEDVDPSTLSYAGRNIGDDKGFQMALGNLDLNTMKKIDDFNPDKENTKLVKPRSRGWNDSRAPQGFSQPSIWSRGYSPGSSCLSAAPPPSDGSALERPSPTRGKERVVSVQGLRLTHKEARVKRPREDSSISDADVLLQYSPSSQKKLRKDLDPCSTDRPISAATKLGTAQPKPRNRFATLLQRRNCDGDGDGQGTRSRFFCSSSTSEVEILCQESSGETEKACEIIQTPSEDLCKTAELDESDGPSIPSVETPSPSSSPSPTSASQGLGLFQWSGSLSEKSQTTTGFGFAALQKFHRNKEIISWNPPGQEPPKSPSMPSPSMPSPVPFSLQDEAPPPDLPPTQDSAYFSQTQHTSCQDDEGPSPNCSEEVTSPFMNSSNDSDCDEKPTSSPETVDRKPIRIRPKQVAGLPRMRPSDQQKGAAIPLSAPARASGLRKILKVPRKKPSPSNENNSGLQSTISGLWKNFGFKKETEKILPCQKGEPMSPVKVNMPVRMPEMDKDIYF